MPLSPLREKGDEQADQAYSGMEVIGLKSFFRFALPAVALLVCACGDGGGGPGPVADYFPLATGNFWEFEVAGSGTIDTLDITASGSLSVTVGSADTLDNGLVAFEVNSQAITIYEIEQGMYSDTTVDLDTFYWYEIGDQISQYESLDDSTARLIHSPPIEVGRVWYPGPDEPNGSYEVMSVSQSVIVPFDTFDECAQIFHDNPDSFSSSNDYMAPGTGYVLIEAHVVSDSGGPGGMSLDANLTYELTDTNL